MNLTLPRLSTLAGLLLLTGCATGQGPTMAAHPEQDRQAILAMAGTFHVTFDFRETVPFVADYKPIAAKKLSGNEVVRVIADDGRTIRLQHLLVVENDKHQADVVKHWRQDWVYEPAELLVYTGAGHWGLKPVGAAERAGAWSQTVYQTDDSPRYGGIGHWRFDDGVARWTSEPTLRPLTRRDATRHPPYDRYESIDRHAITPKGWVQEEDNAKIGTRDGKSVTFTHEVVANSYDRASDFQIDAADTYWAKTKDYWAAVRAAWDAALKQRGTLTVAEVPEDGSATGDRLMGLADDVAEGRLETPFAVSAAQSVIRKTEDMK